jgi:hypothetical protein
VQHSGEIRNAKKWRSIERVGWILFLLGLALFIGMLLIPCSGTFPEDCMLGFGVALLLFPISLFLIAVGFIILMIAIIRGYLWHK